MTISDNYKRKIFHKTGGYCYHCEKKLSWKNYGKLNSRDCWEIDHSLPKSKGGTDHLNNLVPSCIPCNREKSNLTTRQYRKQFEPLSEENSGVGLLGVLIIIGGLYAYFRKIAKRSNS